jgi:CelD/BcsL family acetyltransferase involved in cellulose biosynthesis
VRHEVVDVLDLAALSRLRSEWTQLTKDSPSHSQSLTYECCALAAAPLFAKGGKLCVIKIYDDRGLALLWPISVQRKALIRVARDLRSGSGEEYGGPLLRASVSDEILRASVHAIMLIDADLFELAWVDDGSELQRLVAVVPQPWLARRAPRRLRAAPGSDGMPRYAIHFAGIGSWNDFIATRHRSVRKHHDYRMRQLLKEQENVEFGWCRQADDAEAVLTWLFANKRDWAEARGLRTPYLMTHELRDFCIAVAHGSDLNATPLVTYIKVGGKPVAASFNLVGPKVLEFFITTYDRTFNRYSPGILLLGYAARWAYENGRDFDMRYLHADYKARWANYTVVCRRHALFLTQDNAAVAVVLAHLATWKMSGVCRRRWGAIMRLATDLAGASWRTNRASARPLPEDEREVVGRHRNAFGQFKAMLGGKRRHLVEAAQPPSGIARLQAQIESEVGGSGLAIGLDIGTVEEENAADRQPAAGAGHQALGRGPG